MNDKRIESMSLAIQSLHTVLQRQGQLPMFQLDAILDAYLETRRRVNLEISHLASAHLNGALSTITAAIDRIEGRMRELAPNDPGHAHRVVGYKGVHGLLLQYMLDRVGHAVYADKLRLLTADQVHTERRVRELRDLGYSVVAAKQNGQNTYSIESATQDLDRAARVQLLRAGKRRNGRL